MDDLVQHNSRIYTDIQGLNQLRYENRTNPEAVKKEVARQFESILMQMVLSSMRDANKAFAKDALFGSNEMDMYQDMFDKQLSLLLSDTNSGFAHTVEKTIDQMSSHRPLNDNDYSNGQPTTSIATPPSQPSTGHEVSPDAKDNKQQQTNSDADEQSWFSSPEQFVKKLWSTAKAAAVSLGTSPEILLAQAALETNWGKNILQQNNGDSTHNLFNIKADSNWGRNVATIDSLEQKNGVLVKEKSNFKSYNTFMESFSDYVNLLKGNSRYDEALNNAANPGQFVHALQNSGYATDPNYADKILKIFRSPMFQGLIEKVKQST